MVRPTVSGGFLIALLGGCAPPGAPPAAPPPAAQEPAPEAGTGDENAYGALCRLRGLALEPPLGLAQHYLFEGWILFRFPDGQRPDATNGWQVALGGPGRMVYTLTSGSQRQITRLENPDTAWLRAPGDTAYQRTPPGDLPLAAWLRWTAARFPWDWRAQLDGPPRESYAIHGPHGELRVELDRDGRPARYLLGEIRLQLRDYRQQRSGAWLPVTWEWTLPSVTRVESFELIQDQFTWFEDYFAPPGQRPPLSPWGALQDQAGGAQRMVADDVGLVTRPAVRAVAGPVAGDWVAALSQKTALRLGVWLEIRDGQPVQAAVLLPDGAPEPELSPGLQRSLWPAGIYLRWLTYFPVEPAQAAAEILRAAPTAQFRPAGSVWVQTFPGEAPASKTPRAREILLALQEDGSK